MKGDLSAFARKCINFWSPIFLNQFPLFRLEDEKSQPFIGFQHTCKKKKDKWNHKKTAEIIYNLGVQK